MATADANTTGPFLDNFVSGKTGMIIMANWWEIALKAGMGDAFADIATAPIPVGPSGDEPRSISYSWMTVVNAKATARSRKRRGISWTGSTARIRPNGASAMGDILMSMGILPSRTSDVEAFSESLTGDVSSRAIPSPRQREAVSGGARRAGILRSSAAAARGNSVRPGVGRRRAGERPRPTPPRSSNGMPSKGHLTWAGQPRRDLIRPAADAAQSAPIRDLHARAGDRTDRRFHFHADAADDLAVLPELVVPDRLSRRRSSSASKISSISLGNLRRARLQGGARNTAIYTLLSGSIILPLSVALGLLVHQSSCAGRRAAPHRAVLDLHGADDRGGSGVFQALFADRRAAQPDPRLVGSGRRPGFPRRRRRCFRSSF